MALGRSTNKHSDSCRAYMLLGIAGTTKSFRQGVACRQKPGVWNVLTAVSS
jgi:surface antigen